MMRRPWLMLSGVLALLYLAYVLWARHAGTLGAPPVRLGETGEFLLFFGAMATFTLQIIVDEARLRRTPESSFINLIDANLERWLMLFCYVFCCAVIIQDVGRRFLINYSAAWSQETAQYAFIYLGWIGAAYAVKERAHIRFDILISALPPRAHAYVYLFGEICTILFALVALNFSLHTIDQLWRFEGATPVLRVSKIWAEAALPIGFTLVVLRALQGMARDVADLRAGRSAYRGKALFEE